jgi:predicted anti-sigma-YlaC factor YlaD
VERRFDPNRLSEWLRTIATTEDDEVDCDALMAAAESLVASANLDDDVRAVLPHLALHLDHCPDCREWYDTLVAFARDESAS